MPVLVTVRNACQQAVAGSTVEVKLLVNPALPGTVIRSGNSPVQFAAPSGAFSVIIVAKAPGHYGATVLISFDGKSWSTGNGSAGIDASKDPIAIDVYVGRVRFTPAAFQPDSTVAKSPYNPGFVLLDSRPNYRTAQYNEATFRTLKKPIIADINGTRWDRFKFADTIVRMNQFGVWVNLDYGDAPGSGNDIRQLVGVWAPFRATSRPTVIVQITPNTSIPDVYPSDSLPFTGIYPYGCLTSAAGSVTLDKFRQGYPELPLNRTLTGYAIGYQLYASRSDLFGTSGGPIVITLSPAFLRDQHVLREPTNCREGLGRLIAEVLCFLWSNRITTAVRTGGGKLVFEGGDTRFTPSDMTAAAPEPFPRASLTTVVAHSAAVAVMQQLVGLRTWADLVKQPKVSGRSVGNWFSQDLYGGTTPYGDANWVGMWIVDGVQAGGGFSPSVGSDSARAWLSWQAEQPKQRTVTAVYTEVGLPESKRNGLVPAAPRRTSRAGWWVEEGRDGLVAWVRFSNSALTAPVDAKEVAAFKPSLGPGDVHNRVYSVGVGYAAQAFS